jgi:hypothetical protein
MNNEIKSVQEKIQQSGELVERPFRPLDALVMPPRVLVACEFSGRVRDAFVRLGAFAMSCDLLPSETEGNHYQGDIRDVLSDGWDLMIAHPPCTFLSHAGIGWFNEEKYGNKAKERKIKREDAFQFFMILYNAPIMRICIENPVGWVNSHFRKPDQVIQPYFFGDNHKKGTCLWLKNLRPLMHVKEEDMFYKKTHLPEPEPLTVQFRKPSKYYKGGEIKKRYFTDAATRSPHERSRTFQGIANAMAEQWYPLLTRTA